MSENFAGVVDHAQDDLDLQSVFLEKAAHFAKYRRWAWWAALGGMVAQTVGISLVLGSLPLDLPTGAQPVLHPLVVALSGLLNLAATAGFIACISFYAMSRDRSPLWGVMALFCSCAIPLLILLIIEDFGYGPARAQLERFGTLDIPPSRPGTATIAGLVALILVFSGIGATRFTKAVGSNFDRMQQQSKKGRPGTAGTGAGGWAEPLLPGATAEATPEDDVDAGPLPDIAKRPCLVGSTPGGAAILLDGEPTGKTTPSEITIWAGKDHTVSVVLEGYAPSEKGVFAGLKDTPQLAFELVAFPKVEVATEPEGAEVFVAGKLAIAATPGWFYAEGAETTLTVRKRGFVEVTQRLATTAKAPPAPVSLRLVPAAYVSVESKPAGALVVLDGVKTSLPTPVELAVAAGKKHELQLELDGATTPKTKLKPLKAGASTKVVVDIAAARKAEAKARVKRLSAEFARWNATLRKLEARDTGFAETAAIERKRAAELEQVQQKVDDLAAELDTAREDLAALQEPKTPD